MNTITETKSMIIDWIGDDGETIANLSGEQADELLNWLEENNINIEKNEDVDKLSQYIIKINSHNFY